MEDQIERLVDKVWTRLQQTPKDHRFMVAIGGIPGSGKTTVSIKVTNALNARHSAQNHPGGSSSSSSSSAPLAAFVPMDGYHLTRAQLSAMPDPAHAFARRGAEFTFDGTAFHSLVSLLRDTPLDSSAKVPTIFAPSFDHAKKDPQPDDIPILPHHRVVVFEGNYVCLDRTPWREAADLMDERWFVDIPDMAVARNRLIKRHVAAGIAADEEAAGKRADENDLVNGEEILRLKVPTMDEVVVSREDKAWGGS